MDRDEVLEEIYRIREEHAKAFNYNIKAICKDLQNRQVANRRKLISKPLKPRCKQPNNLALGDRS